MKRLVLLALLMLSACSVPGLVNPLALLQPSPTSALPEPVEFAPTPTAQAAAVLTDRIVFSSERSGAADIYTMNADGSGLARLTDHPAADYDPAWSPNRRQIAFVSERSGTPNIYLMSSDGSNVRQLTDEPQGALQPTFAPDGQQIAYVAVRNAGRALVELTLVDATTRVLFTTPPSIAHPAYAPNGQQIAFSAVESVAGGGREIYLANRDRSGVLINLTNSPGDDDAPSFSPDGARIAFHSNRDGYAAVYVMAASGAAQTPLTAAEYAAQHPSWAADGRQLVFSGTISGRPQIYLTDDAGNVPVRLGTATADAVTPAFPPPPPLTAGDQLLIATGAVGGNRNIQLVSPGGLGRTTLTADLLFDNITPAWSPDGQRIAFASDRGGNYDIYVIGSDGSGLTLVAGSPGRDLHPVWSPDGERIAFESNRDGTWDVYVTNADGSGGLINITNHPASDGNPAWSPDGGRIAFASNRGGPFDIYVIDELNPAALINLTNNPANDVQPAWSPDGANLVFRSDRSGDNEIYLLDVNEPVRTRRLTFHPADDTMPAFAPDGRRIAFASNRSTITGGAGAPSRRDYDVYIVNVISLDLTRLDDQPTNAQYPAWRPRR